MEGYPPLKEITVEITQQCFQNCVHCSSSACKNSQQSLWKDEIIELANDFNDLGGEKINVSGGEPFLHEDLFDLISFFKSRNLEVNLFTCGKIEKNDDSENIMDEVIRKLKKTKINKIVFSLHGANAETHDAIAQIRNSFSQAIKFIEKLIDSNFDIGIHYVPMNPNFEELEDLIDYAVNLKVKEVSILRFVPQGRGETYRDELLLNKEQVAELIELLTESEKREDIYVKIGSHLDFTFLIDGKEPKDCTAGKSKCLIEANGVVIPCAAFKGMEGYVAGNIREKSLNNIWMNSKVFEIFRTFDPVLLKGACSTCEHLSSCKGRCPAQRIYDGDFLLGPDSYCPKEFF